MIVKAPAKRRYSRKFWTFGALSIASYILMFSTLFLDFAVLKSMIFVLCFFLFFHFLYLEIRRLPIKYLMLCMLIITLIEGFFVGYAQLLLVASLVAINTGIVMLAHYLQSESCNKITFSSPGYFNVGGYIFTVFITIGYSLFVLGYYAKFPFNCTDLSDASDRVTNFFTNPMAKNSKEVVTNEPSVFDMKIKDIAAIGQSISLQTNKSSYTMIIQKINAFKKQFIDQALKENKAINMGICDFVLGELNKVYGNPGVQASVLILMFLLLYGFVRIVFWVMTIIALLLFRLLFVFKAYRVTMVTREMEDLE